MKSESSKYGFRCIVVDINDKSILIFLFHVDLIIVIDFLS